MAIGRRIATTAAAATLILAAAPAQNAAADPPCYSGEVCVYYGGSLIAKFPPVPYGACRSLNHSYDYMRNLSGIWQRAWSGNWCEGASKWVAPGTGAPINLWWSVGG